MAFLERLARFLRRADPLSHADAILVLDGGEAQNRIARGVELMRQGYALHLLIDRTTTQDSSPGAGDPLPVPEPERVHWIVSDAQSTREEVIEARGALRLLKCKSVLVLTSYYHTRRARLILDRELGSHGFHVRIIPVATPAFNEKTWWKSQPGRATLTLEYLKLVPASMHFKFRFLGRMRRSVKEWALRTIP